MSAHSPDMNELKSLLRGLLISTRKAMTAEDLHRDFKSQEGYNIPYRKFGKATFLDFLQSIPDTVKIEPYGPRGPIITPVLSEKSSHVEALVQKQRVNPPKRGRHRVAPLRRNAVNVPVARQPILIPYQLQQRLVTWLVQNPDGIEMEKLEANLDARTLHNYGIFCTLYEVIENLGHIIKVINGRVYLVEGTMYNRPPFQINYSQRYRFMPPRVQSQLRQMQECYSVRSETVPRAIRPAGYEDQENACDLQKNGDLNLEEFDDEEEIEEEIGRGDTVNGWDRGTVVTQENLTKTENSTSEEISVNSSSLVSNVMRSNLLALLEKNPSGIRCSQLPHLYKECFKVDLDYRGFGFCSVLQMVSNLPDLFHCIRQDGEDWKVLDVRNPLPDKYKSCDMKTTARVYKNTQPHVPTRIKNNIERLLMLNSSGLWSEFFLDKYQEMFGHSINYQELNFDSLESFLLFLNDGVLHMRYVTGRIMLYPHVEQEEPKNDSPLPHIVEPTDLFLELYPPEVVGPKVTIPQQKLPPDTGPGSYLEVLVAEVYTPQNFWLQLRGEKTHMALDKLMNDIQIFYEQEFDYKMPEVTVRTDQLCMAPFNDEYHRARIIAVPNLTEAQVCFVDYGTKSKVKRCDLRFMHQDFAKFPIQAIRASLANIRPANGAAKWSRSVSQRFLHLVSDKNLIAIVSTADHEHRELEVALVDTTGEEDIHINDTLKHEGLAEYRTHATAAAAPAPPQPQPPSSAEAAQPRIETDNTAPTPHRPPPGFMPSAAPPAAAPVFNTGTAPAPPSDIPPSGAGQPCYAPSASDYTAYLNSTLLAAANPMQLWNIQQAYLAALMMGNPLMYANPFATLANLGMPMVNPSVMFTPPPMTNKSNSSMPEVKVPQAPAATAPPQSVPTSLPTKSSSSQSIPTSKSNSPPQNVPTSLPTKSSSSQNIPTSKSNSPRQNAPTSKSNSPPDNDTSSLSTATVETLNSQMSKMNMVDVPCSPEPEAKNSTSICSTDSSVLEQYDVIPMVLSENTENGPMSEEDDDVFRSDDDDADVVVENVTEENAQTVVNAEPPRPVYVKQAELARKVVHIVNVRSVAYLCTEEVVRLFTEFSGRHVILKILDAKNVMIPFREISRRESPEIMEALDTYEIVGLPKSFIAGTLMGKVHLTPLGSVLQLLTVLNVKNREVYRGIQEEMNKFNSQDSYWTSST